jgi:hypothetical protein
MGGGLNLCSLIVPIWCTVIILSFTVVCTCVLIKYSHPSGPWSVPTASDEWRQLSSIVVDPVSFFSNVKKTIYNKWIGRVPNILLTRIFVIVLYLWSLVVVFAGKIETLTAVLFVIQYDLQERPNYEFLVLKKWFDYNYKTHNIIV